MPANRKRSSNKSRKNKSQPLNQCGRNISREGKSPKPSYLCARCHKIDLSIFDCPEKIKSRFGRPIASLGLPKDWNPLSCRICRLLHRLHLAIEERIKNDPTRRYQLYAYCSKRSYYSTEYLSNASPKQIKMEPRTFMGIMPQNARLLEADDRDQYRPSAVGFLACSEPSVEDKPVIYAKMTPKRIDFAAIRRWVNVCLDVHGDHGQAPRDRKRDNMHSLRLIDCRLRAIVDARPNDLYVALSYVWGNCQGESKVPLGAIPEPAPAVIEDAMLAVVSLGFRFLWVDRYCIFQGDEADKLAQIPHMDATYKNAQLTIIAAAGDGSEYGLPGVRDRERATQPVEEIESRILFAVPGDPSHLVQDSTWIGRAWTYQEAVLSPRRLIFTEEQVYFECPNMVCRETVETHPGLHQDKTISELPLIKSIFPPLGRSLVDIDSHIITYSQKQLSYPEDILNGIRGILRAYQSANVQHFQGIPLLLLPEYYQSTWTQAFLAGLRWSHEKPTSRRKSRSGQIVFSSWSWCGWMDHPEWAHKPPRAITRWPETIQTAQIEISVERRNGDFVDVVPLDTIAHSAYEVESFTSRLHINAFVAKTRFTYLSTLPAHWKKREEPYYRPLRLPGFHVVLTRDDHQRIHSFAPLYLDVPAPPGSDLYRRLENEEWACVVVEVARYDGWPTGLLLCEWEGDTARRIGYISPSQSTKIAEEPFMKKYYPKWETTSRSFMLE